MDAKTATAKHAPGPWDYFVGNANGRGLIRIEQSGTGQHIASMQRGAVSGANARLIAAAPELLEMLRLARECIAYCREAHPDAQSGSGLPIEVLIDAVIAKAEAA